MHFMGPSGVRPDDVGLEFADLESAYLDARQAIPEAAKLLLIDGRDPMVCAFLICDAAGRLLLEVPFTEALSPEWRRLQPTRGPASAVRSDAARCDLARAAFDRALGGSPIPHMLVTPEFEVVSINPAGLTSSGANFDQVEGRPLAEAFGGFAPGMTERMLEMLSLARQGLRARALDLHHIGVTQDGRVLDYWFVAEAWPVLDDDGRLLGVANHALPFERPVAGGATRVMVATDAYLTLPGAG